MPANKVQDTSAPEFKGDGVNQQLENGPMEKRSCTDPLCCLFFIAFMCGMIGVSAYSISKGNPDLIGRGYDSDGKMCGIDDGYEDYSYLYFPIPIQGYLNQTVCVKSCPADPLGVTVDCKTNSAYPACIGSNNVDLIKNAIQLYLDTKTSLKGTFYIYDTIPFVDRFCIPSKVEEMFGNASSAVFDSDLLDQWVSDLRHTWQILVCSFGVAFLLGVVYMFLLRYCSGVITWLTILCFIVGTAILGWQFYQKAEATEEATAETDATKDSESSVYKTSTALKAIAYTCWAVSVFTVLAVICLFNRIRLAIAIIKAAADYVKETPSAMLVPVGTVLCLTSFYAYWGFTAVYLISSGDATHVGDTAFGSFTFDKNLKRLLAYHLFGLLWFNAFVIAATQFVLASSTCLWYFSQGTGQGAKGTIRKSIHRVLRYHFGSIAFGSLIIAIIQFIRIILAYVEQQAKKLQGKEGKIVQYVLGCLQCVMACFERFIKFLNKNAYIQIALTGKSFCGAAKDAFQLITNNPLRMSILNGVGSIFVFFGKVFVAVITALIAFLVMTKWDKFSAELYSPFIPTLVIFIFAYGIGAVFMTVYGLAADAILACFVVDENLSKQKNAAPRHCPESLKSFIDKQKKN